jgi:DNA-binding CsgD family transcriptional regulator
VSRRPRIRVTVGNHAGEAFDLEEGEWIVGKGRDARIRLTDSGVSRRHAKIVRSSDGLVVVVDLQSTNGTYVNDVRTEVARLQEGARIGIGPDAELAFDYVPDGEADADADVAAAGRSGPGEHPLTPRELEIARLVARGLTNPQVAARLSIKTRTVASHLDNIYARLKISSRAALTRYVIERGLDEGQGPAQT